jgi:glycosyltransferase involved in cell wall biosynthesis
MIDIAYLSDAWRWHGEHSGYDLLPQYVRQLVDAVRVTSAPPRLASRINWMRDSVRFNDRRNWGYYPGSDRIFLKEFAARPGCIGHVLYFERHREMLKRWGRVPKTIVTTLHNRPDPELHPAFYEGLRRMHSAIVLYRRDKDFFEQFVESREVAFIHHGVDSDFFTPAVAPAEGARRLLYVGINGRDIAMLKRVVARLDAAGLNVLVDLVVPKSNVAFNQLRRHPKITWHDALPDHAFKLLYQASYLLLLPMKASGANNAVVESMACGVPPVTTDIGGIRDYGGGSLYPVVAPGDEVAMVDLIQRYLREPGWRNQVGDACRAFAERNLAWPLVALKHLEFYRRLLSA